MKIFICAVLLSAFTASASAAPKPKQSICHFDEESGGWVALALPANAAQNHLTKHDDAAPGGITAITGTQLDDNCLPTAVDVPPEAPAPEDPAAPAA